MIVLIDHWNPEHDRVVEGEEYGTLTECVDHLGKLWLDLQWQEKLPGDMGLLSHHTYSISWWGYQTCMPQVKQFLHDFIGGLFCLVWNRQRSHTIFFQLVLSCTLNNHRRTPFQHLLKTARNISCSCLRSFAIFHSSVAGVSGTELWRVPDYHHWCRQHTGMEREPAQEGRNPVPSCQSHTTRFHVSLIGLTFWNPAKHKIFTCEP